MLEKMALVLLRIVLGTIFFAHGLAKWRKGMEEVAEWFAGVGLPTFLAYAVTCLELFGGIALILGLATRYVALIMAFLMLGAIVTVKLPAGLIGHAGKPGYELDLTLLAIALFLSAARREESV
jgi:putative oxidoreductase